MTEIVRQKFLSARVLRALNGLRDQPLPNGEMHHFAAITELVAALYHNEFHGRAKAITECWEDAEAGDTEAATELSERLTRLLEDSNYQRVTVDELDEAVSKELLLPLRLRVDLDDYRELLIYRNGSHHDTVETRKWDRIRTEQRRVTVDNRLVVHTQVQPAAWFAERGINPAKRGLEPGRIDLRHFRDTPRANIKTLLPSVRVRYRLVDSLKMGVPALASGIVVLTTKLLTTLGLMFVLIGAWLGLRKKAPELDQASLVVLFGGLAALGGFVARQYSKLKNRHVQYLKILSEHLFNHTLGDGSAVVYTLLYAAEHQEVAEVLLGYRFLLDHPQGYRAAELDAMVEAWIETETMSDIDFDVAGSLTKLRYLNLVVTEHSGDVDDPTFQAVGTAVARRVLIDRWVGIFDAEFDDAVPVTTQHG